MRQERKRQRKPAANPYPISTSHATRQAPRPRDKRRLPPKAQNSRPLLASSEGVSEIKSPKDTAAGGRKNQDFCEDCGDGGWLICCEYCVRSYHGVCLEFEVSDLPDVWACPECERSQNNLDSSLDMRARLSGISRGSPPCDEETLQVSETSHAFGAPGENTNARLRGPLPAILLATSRRTLSRSEERPETPQSSRALGTPSENNNID